MKRFLPFLLIILFVTSVLGQVKISNLPLGTGSAVNTGDSFPYVDSINGVTRRLLIYDLINTPPLSAPTFSGHVTSLLGFIGNLSGNATNITATSNSSLLSIPNLATVGTITTGVWNGTTIAIANGGTGQTASGTSGQFLESLGGGLSTWKTTTPSQTIITATGATAGYFFLTTGANVTIGATYTDSSSHVFTAIETVTGQVNLFMTGASAPTGTTLTKASGTGDSPITFTQSQTYATYTPPAGCTLLKVTAISGGGGGGGVPTGSGQSAAAAGGAGGAAAVSYYTTIASSFPYTVGVGGAGGSAGSNSGATGHSTVFGDNTTGRTFATGGGGGNTGALGTTSTSNGTTAVATPTQGAGVAINGYSIGGGPGLPGIILVGSVVPGSGGYAALGFAPGAAGGNGGGGSTGNIYGGGGAGAGSFNNGGTFAGGTGGSGILIIEPFFN